jgi:vacuolar-type H+-ATPase subunit H
MGRTIEEVNASMAKAVWEEIQATEIEAKRIIEDAKSASVATLKKARQEAADLIEQAQEQARTAGEQLLNKTTVQAETAKQARLAAIDVTVQNFSAAGAERLPGAIKMIVEKVVS